MKKILALAILVAGLWATENLGENAEIVNMCSAETALGIKTSLSTLDLANMSEEQKSLALLQLSGTFSQFYKYCVAFYQANPKLIACIEPEFVLQDFIAKSMVENQNQQKELQ